MHVEGTVISGLGKGQDFVTLDGYAKQFQTKLGYEPFPGTLNLSVTDPVHQQLDDFTSIRIDEWETEEHSFGAVNCYPVTVLGMNGTNEVAIHVIVPDRTEHDTSTIELISPVNLRKAFNLSDGATIEIRIEPGPPAEE